MLSGYGAIPIAKILTNDKVLIPAAMKLRRGDTRFKRYIEEGSEYTWTDGIISHILNNHVYTGDMVGSKTQIVNYKTKKSINNKKDKWIIVPNTHESIITHEEFDQVQELKTYRQIERKVHKVENLFRGLIRCSVCGKTKILTTQMRRGRLEVYYRCNSFTSFRTKTKHWTTIKDKDLREIVKTRLKEFIHDFKNDNKLIELIKTKISENNLIINYEKEIAKVNSRLNALTNITKKVYDDYFEELINKETYLELIKKYQTEQSNLKEKHTRLINEQNNKGNLLEDVVNSFLDLKELKREIIFMLIERIEVECVGGYKQHKQRNINISYRFVRE